MSTPAPGPGEVLIDVKASGLCHSDVGVLEGTIRGLPFTPITLGHEIAGTVAALGEGAGGFSIGQRVAVPSSLENPGVGSDGGFADLVVAGQDQLIALPDDIGFAEAAVATDAGMTSYHAIHLAGVTRGTRVGVIGLGGLGLLGAQIASALGAEVYGAEINQTVWPEDHHDLLKTIHLVFKDQDDADACLGSNRIRSAAPHGNRNGTTLCSNRLSTASTPHISTIAAIEEVDREE